MDNDQKRNCAHPPLVLRHCAIPPQPFNRQILCLVLFTPSLTMIALPLSRPLPRKTIGYHRILPKSWCLLFNSINHQLSKPKREIIFQIWALMVIIIGIITIKLSSDDTVNIKFLMRCYCQDSSIGRVVQFRVDHFDWIAWLIDSSICPFRPPAMFTCWFKCFRLFLSLYIYTLYTYIYIVHICIYQSCPKLSTVAQCCQLLPKVADKMILSFEFVFLSPTLHIEEVDSCDKNKFWFAASPHIWPDNTLGRFSLSFLLRKQDIFWQRTHSRAQWA